MKIALVVPGGVDRSGERRVVPALLALIERLARQHEVHVFALAQESRPARWRLAGAEIHNIGGRGRLARVLRAVRAIGAEHRRAPFDLVQAIWSGWVGVVASMAGRLLGLPVAIHLTGGELVAIPQAGYGSLRSLHWRIVEPRILKRAAAVSASSSVVVKAAAQWQVRAERIPLGVDIDCWPIRPPQPRPRDAPARLIHVASLNRVKDQATLLHAIKLLRERQIALRLDVVGEDTLQGALQRLADRLGIADCVTFHGFLTQRELRPLMEAAHVHVFSSLHEAGPFVLLEAAIAGIPSVGTRVGHVLEWPTDAVIGVPLADAASMARGIVDLLADESLRLAVAAAAQRCAMAEDADVTAASFARLHERIAALR